MGFYKSENDKQSGDGLSITEWNDLSNALAGHSGLTLATSSTDKIGIGTSSPQAKLQVTGGAIMPSVGKTESDGILFPKDPHGGGDSQRYGDAAWLRYYRRSNSVENMTLELGITNNAGDHIALMPSGNVGIGTHNPTNKLEVEGNVKATKFIGDGSELTNLSVGFKGLNLATESGSVGIGTTSPTQKLEVTGNALLSGKKAVLYLNDTNKGIFYSAKKQRGNDYDEWIQDRPIDGPVVFGCKDFALGTIHNGKKIALYGDSDGKVGIGTTTPSAKLEVNGDVKVTGKIEGGIWYSKEYTWEVKPGSTPPSAMKMGPSDSTVAFLTSVQGDFEGPNELVHVYTDGGYWYLHGKSELSSSTAKRTVVAKARCIGKPYADGKE